MAVQNIGILPQHYTTHLEDHNSSILTVNRFNSIECSGAGEKYHIKSSLNL
jgi:hypothetical protein